MKLVGLGPLIAGRKFINLGAGKLLVSLGRVQRLC
jgi:hypothetical protein